MLDGEGVFLSANFEQALGETNWCHNKRRPTEICMTRGSCSSTIAGAVLGTFEDQRFKSESKKPLLESIEIFGLGSGPELEEKLSQTVKLAAGVIFAKQLVNAPPNVLIPSKSLLP